MSAAKILAIGGLASAVMGTAAGLLGNVHGVGVASAVMLLANIAALVVRDTKAVRAPRVTPRGTVTDSVGFASLRAGNLARHAEWWVRDGVKDVTLEFRGNELAGEVGEACNVIKKLARERLGIMGSRDCVDHLAEELADVVICVDLIAMDLGLDLGGIVATKFNMTSEKLGLKTKLRGFAGLRLLVALTVSMLVTIGACSLVGHELADRDRAIAARDASDHSLNVCLAELRSTVERVHRLRAQVDLHAAIDEDACACWVAP